jgi:hypothetical protein
MKGHEQGGRQNQHGNITERKNTCVRRYDVDGTTSVAMLYSISEGEGIPVLIITSLTVTLKGYGLSSKGIDYAAEGNCRLIIALDCGIQGSGQVKICPVKRDRHKLYVTITFRVTAIPKLRLSLIRSSPAADILQGTFGLRCRIQADAGYMPRTEHPVRGDHTLP